MDRREKIIRDCRLRTLKKDNPWGEMQEQTDSDEEKHKRIYEHIKKQNKKHKTKTKKPTTRYAKKTYGGN